MGVGADLLQVVEMRYFFIGDRAALVCVWLPRSGLAVFGWLAWVRGWVIGSRRVATIY